MYKKIQRTLILGTALTLQAHNVALCHSNMQADLAEGDHPPVTYRKSHVIGVFNDEGIFRINGNTYTVLGGILGTTEYTDAWYALPDATLLTFTWVSDTWYYRQQGENPDDKIDLFLWPTDLDDGAQDD